MLCLRGPKHVHFNDMRDSPSLFLKIGSKRAFDTCTRVDRCNLPPKKRDVEI